MALQMSPSPIVYDTGYFVLAYAKKAGKLCLIVFACFVKRPNLDDLRRYQLTLAVAVTASISALLGFVRVIGRARSNPQMRGINACSVITARTIVQDTPTIGNRSMMYQPRQNVGSNALSGCAISLKRAIASFVLSSNPKPATGGFNNPAPKSVNDGGCTLTFSQQWIAMKRNAFVAARFKTGMVGLHSKFVLLCRALGHSTAAGVFPSYHAHV